MEILCIWAQDQNGAIGNAGAIPWHIPEDFSHFKTLTANSAVIMGRKTWESLPKKPLPGRYNLVVTSSAAPLVGAARCSTLAAALAAAQTNGYSRVFLIGGQALYKEGLPLSNVVHRTIIHTVVVEADTYAPSLPADWSLVNCTEVKQAGALEFHFETWKRDHSAT